MFRPPSLEFRKSVFQVVVKLLSSARSVRSEVEGVANSSKRASAC